MSIIKEITKIIEYQNSTLLLKDKENKTYPAPIIPHSPKTKDIPESKTRGYLAFGEGLLGGEYYLYFATVD